MRKLAWLVPPPTQHQLRYAGVLAPAAKLRLRAGRIDVLVGTGPPQRQLALAL